MNAFGLLIGHLVGDFLLQCDWMAKNKSSRTPHCLIHCLVYTLAIWAFSFWWMPEWSLGVVFATHFPIDRWRLARRYMAVAGMEGFATGPLSPWSIVVVDQAFHLIVLFAVGIAKGG